MGMDYEYSGSASYPRFDEELCAVAAVFGGAKTEHLEARELESKGDFLKYWFGFLSSDRSDIPKFVFPEGTNEVLVWWFNHIYEYAEPDKTAIIWKHVSEHPEIKEISSQLWDELQKLAEYGEGWRIY